VRWSRDGRRRSKSLIGTDSAERRNEPLLDLESTLEEFPYPALFWIVQFNAICVSSCFFSFLSPLEKRWIIDRVIISRQKVRAPQWDAYDTDDCHYYVERVAL
jgi:hypothetical protein